MTVQSECGYLLLQVKIIHSVLCFEAMSKFYDYQLQVAFPEISLNGQGTNASKLLRTRRAHCNIPNKNAASQLH